MEKQRTLMNIGEDTTLGNGNMAQKLVQFLVVADGELEMAGDDTGLLVVASSVTGQLKDFGCQVLKNSCEIDRSACDIGQYVSARCRGIRTHQHQHVARSCLSSRDDGHGQLGMLGRLWKND